MTSRNNSTNKRSHTSSYSTPSRLPTGNETGTTPSGGATPLGEAPPECRGQVPGPVDKCHFLQQPNKYVQVAEREMLMVFVCRRHR